MRSWRTGLPDLQVHCEEQTQLLNLYKASASGLRIANAALRVDLLPSALSPFVRPIIERPEAKIIAAVKQVESGRKVEEIAREVGVFQAHDLCLKAKIRRPLVEWRFNFLFSPADQRCLALNLGTVVVPLST